MTSEGTCPYRVGAAIADFGPPTLGVAMMGWGMLDNVVDGAATPIHARAFLLEHDDSRIAIVVCEIAFISHSVKDAVVTALEAEHPELGLHDANVLLTATHTHSAPGGFSHDHFYNITIPGHAPDALDWVVDGIVAAVVQAGERLEPARVRYLESDFDSDQPVAFNRSIESYNLNGDVNPVRMDETTRPLDHTMRMLAFENEEGQPVASINWFAVHCTSIHSDNRQVHFDNKGYAAEMLEADAAVPEFVGAFAQGAAGDVSPNFKVYPEKPWTRGSHLDDDASARDNGRMQFKQARSTLDCSSDSDELSGPLEYAHRYVDFSTVEVDDRHGDGASSHRTGPAEIGLAMFFGTAEGPGLPRRLRFIQQIAQRARSGLVALGIRDKEKSARRTAVQGDKLTVVEAGRRRVLGITRWGRFRPLGGFHPALNQFLALDQTGHDDPKSWIQQLLPIQVLRIGPIAIVAVPAEFTTTSGRRLRASVGEALAARGVDHVVLAGYSNSYAGYVTTHEEYQNQDYEGASTLFGRWTLAAYQTSFDRLVTSLSPHRDQSVGPRPPTVRPADLEGRLFVASDA